MKKIKINIPEGTEYLSHIWENLKNQLPSGHYILNKNLCNCGATEAFIRDSKTKTILASPRKQLLYNKHNQHLNDTHLYRFEDKDQYFSHHKDSPNAILNYNDRLKEFVREGGTKILVTYDSLNKIADVLTGMGQKLNDWLVVIDEFQAIFYDAFYKPTTEIEFISATNKFKDVVYLSATPYLEEYLDSLSQFKNLPFVELVWPEGYTERPNVEMTRCSSLQDTVAKIIQDYRDGNGKTTFVGGETFTSKEAVIYVNSIKVIIEIIKRNELKPEEVDIICAGSNKSLLQKHGHEIAVVPGRNEPRKMFTLCTSTVYLGADMYSPDAYTFIFADPRITSMALDVSTDLIQIIGRQRLEENPFMNSATLFYTTKECDMSKDEFSELMRQKELRSQEKIKNFESAPFPETMLNDYENTIKQQKYSQDFCSVVLNHKTGKQEVVINELVIASQMRSWQILHDIYSNEYALNLAVRKKCNVKQTINSDDPDVQAFFEQWNKDRNFSRRMKLFCSTDEETIAKTSFIPKKYFTYYDALGEEGLQTLSWREDYIKAALTNLPFNPVPKSEIARRVIEAFHEGTVKSRKEVKAFLQELYDEQGIDKRATAEDINEYVTTKKTAGSGFMVVSHQRRNVSLFPQLTNTERSETWDIDKILDMIRTDSYYHLKDNVEAVRRANDKDTIDKKKSFLPLVCWNGVFKYRDSYLDNLSIYSSYTALDFDHFNSGKEMMEFKEMLKGIEWVYAVYTTPSGKGLKAIVQHDNIFPEYHTELYNELLSRFDIPETDPHTKDLARGNYLSYDPDIWKNPHPRSYHFVVPDSLPQDHQPLTYTVVKGEQETPMIYKDDITESSMLHMFCTSIISDRSVLNILRKRWENDDRSKGRNNRAFSYLGILCKAGIPKAKAIEFVTSLFPNWSSGTTEIQHAAEWAYTHNPFGCDRMKFKSHK
jgi:hypothetical protein